MIDSDTVMRVIFFYDGILYAESFKRLRHGKRQETLFKVFANSRRVVCRFCFTDDTCQRKLS